MVTVRRRASRPHVARIAEYCAGLRPTRRGGPRRYGRL